MLLGVFVLRRTAAPGAVGRRSAWARSAVAVLTVDYGRLPYIALALAVSFAGYGLAKKRLGLPAPWRGCSSSRRAGTAGALAYLSGWRVGARSTFGQVTARAHRVLVSAGAATAIPLLLFARRGQPVAADRARHAAVPGADPAARLGVLIFHEPMPPARLAGFALVWLALLIFTLDALRHGRRNRAAARVDTPLPATAH